MWQHWKRNSGVNMMYQITIRPDGEVTNIPPSEPDYQNDISYAIGTQNDSGKWEPHRASSIRYERSPMQFMLLVLRKKFPDEHLFLVSRDCYSNSWKKYENEWQMEVDYIRAIFNHDNWGMIAANKDAIIARITTIFDMLEHLRTLELTPEIKNQIRAHKLALRECEQHLSSISAVEIERDEEEAFERYERFLNEPRY